MEHCDSGFFQYNYVLHTSNNHMNKDLVRISKFLSLVLRHKPEAIELILDEHGWAVVDDLLELAKRSGRVVSRVKLEQVVAQNDKRRFSFNFDGTKIRANQGHSLNIDLALSPTKPPDILYHGTAIRLLNSIKFKGLTSRNRQHVHLSLDEKTAIKVGQRHGKPVVLRIDAKAMHKQNINFYLSENGVWLTEAVPIQYISFPENLS